MNEDLRDRLRFYQELGIEAFFRRARPRARPASSVPVPGESPQPDPLVVPAGSLDLFQAVAPRETLEEIRADLGDGCRRCKLHAGRRTIVFGSGRPRADVVFVGEGPGADEDEQGLPFVGRAGQLLTEMINKSAERMQVPLRREHCYICNVMKCRPPGNRLPERDEIDACLPFLLRQLDSIRPRAIVALGATAAHALLGRVEAMARIRGRWFDFRGARLLVTYHTAYLLRDPSKKREAWEDMQMLLRFLYNLE
jgi:DNA polymerase